MIVSDQDEVCLREILAEVKPLAVEYYRLAGKPLGVTGEIAEYVAAKQLGLTLCAARIVGFDAKRGKERIQMKGRAAQGFGKSSGRAGVNLARGHGPPPRCRLSLTALSLAEPQASGGRVIL